MTLANPNVELSLKCDLSTPASHWKLAANEQGRHKVVWYLNGLYLHSSASSDVYNFTANALRPAVGGGGGGPLELAGQQLMGTVSCAHQLVASQAEPADNFHSGAIRVYQSANQFELRYRGKY